jgi:uncharacterized protein (TIGR00661 family)
LTSKKNILVAPLNWGIGHATRCIPIINKLIKLNFNPIIASDGDALKLLRKEFPKLKCIELPSYNIKYPKKGLFFKWKIISLAPKILKAVKEERKIIEKLISSEDLSGIISDNRFGVRSKRAPSVFISHQLNVLSGSSTFLSSFLHQKYINKFDQCWIPDSKSMSLAYKLSNSSKVKKQQFIGLLSRFKKQNLPIIYDLLIVLSGVEPLRAKLEKKLISELKNYDGRVLFVQGVITEIQETWTQNNITFYNFLLSNELEKAINQSELILSRSGYSTIMDLAVLEKKAFFIPTEGQYEQEYLAKHLRNLRIAPFSSTKKFNIELLKEVENYDGFSGLVSEINSDLFNLFHSK